jgi:drug/metabolite transporter (DMT)-like permease
LKHQRPDPARALSPTSTHCRGGAVKVTASKGAGLAYLMLTLVAAFWAGNTIVGRAVTGTVPPLGLSFWRWAVALVILAPVGVPRVWAARAIIMAHWRILSLLSFLGIACFSTLVFVGLNRTSAVNGALLQGTMTINIVLVSAVLLGRLITPRQGIGVGLGFIGMALIVTGGDIGALSSFSLNGGDLMIWLAVALYAVYSVLLRRSPEGLDVIALMTVMMAVGGLMILPFYLWETVVAGRAMQTDWTTLWSVLYVALFPSVLAQIFWVAAVARVGATTAGYFIYLTPVFGTLMAVALLGEALGWYHIAGITLIFAGIYIATMAGRRSA